MAVGRSGLDHKSIGGGFVVDRVALAHIFLRAIQFSSVSIIPPMLRTPFLHVALKTSFE